MHASYSTFFLEGEQEIFPTRLRVDLRQTVRTCVFGFASLHYSSQHRTNIDRISSGSSTDKLWHQKAVMHTEIYQQCIDTREMSCSHSRRFDGDCSLQKG
jgi:hypothetical protein